MLQNNELLKKADSTKKASGLFVKGQRGRSKSRGPKRDLKASSGFSCYFFKKSGHIKKNCIKYKKMLKMKDDKDCDRASTSGKLDQAGVVKKADEDSCDVLTIESEKVNIQMLGYLTRRAHTTLAQKRSDSVLTSLMMEALS